MDLENQEPSVDAADAPRKRTSRRVISTELAPEDIQKAATETPSAPAEDAEGGGPRRRRAVKQDAPAPEASEEAPEHGESQDDNGEAGEGNGYGRNRGRGRGRDRRRGRPNFADDGEPDISDDDVLIPIGGILDVLDNYAFVRTLGYLPGPTDVYVSLGQVKKYNLRKGDAVIGAIRQPREGDHQGRQKYNALVSIDSINGQSVDDAASRIEFSALTAVYPTQRLQMETTADNLVGRVVDVFAPIGKGQRGVIVGGPKTGKSTMLASLAASVATNAPEAHLMVVALDEHPEAITELQRSVKGEVIASTFDRSADDHTTIAELAVERAKRLVELGHDVVVLIDSLTRLARAYQQGFGGRGGSAESAWIYPTKKLFGAARKVENGGSLTIIGTLVTATGVTVDDVVASEIAGSATMEMHLSQHAAAQRMFPAVDIAHSGTSKSELLMAKDELAAVAEIRRHLQAHQVDHATKMVVDAMGSTGSNVEFLVSMRKQLS